MLPSGGHVLDIGSGPGWDADFLEGLGARVRRTDVTKSFRDFQAERGQQVDALDVLTDKIAETYDGILMLCVLQHFERTELDGVLHKLVNALRDERSDASIASSRTRRDLGTHGFRRLPRGAVVERGAG